MFHFATAGKIIFGPGTIGQATYYAKHLGRHAMVVTGSTPERAEPLIDSLKAAHVKCLSFQVATEPDLGLLTTGSHLAWDHGCDLVIGIGGGSVIDSAKAIAALITNRSPILDYLEVIGKARPLENPPAACIAIPSTAGTGSEVTRNAVIRSKSDGVKVSMRSPDMLPDVAIVDPELTLSLSPEMTAATGFDALCQLLEAYVSTKANPLTDSFCREGLARCRRSFQKACADGHDLDARTDMALASLFSGLALANAGLGAVHGIAGPLGGMHDAPHGAVCARLLPVITAVNVKTLQKDNPQSPALERYTEIARLFTADGNATAQEGIQWLQATADQLQIPPLNRWGLTPGEVPALARQAAKASSMQANPVALSIDALEDSIYQALERSY